MDDAKRDHVSAAFREGIITAQVENVGILMSRVPEAENKEGARYGVAR
jgi:hypothetical protein